MYDKSYLDDRLQNPLRHMCTRRIISASCGIYIKSLISTTRMAIRWTFSLNHPPPPLPGLLTFSKGRLIICFFFWRQAYDIVLKLVRTHKNYRFTTPPFFIIYLAMRLLPRMNVKLDFICMGSVELRGNAKTSKWTILVRSANGTQARHDRQLKKPSRPRKYYFLWMRVLKSMLHLSCTKCVYLHLYK